MKSIYLKIALVFCGLSTITNASAQTNNLPQLGKNPIADVVKAMTLEEKASLLVGGGMYVPGMPMPGAPATRRMPRRG